MANSKLLIIFCIIIKFMKLSESRFTTDIDSQCDEKTDRLFSRRILGKIRNLNDIPDQVSSMNKRECEVARSKFDNKDYKI